MYFFILGHNPTLSIAEIFSLFKENLSSENIVKLSEEVLILKTKEKIEPEKLQKKLGGTIKIGEIIFNGQEFKIDLFLKEILKKSKIGKKIPFGFSLYKLNRSANLKKFYPEIKSLSLEIKKKLKENGISSRWVTSKEEKLSSATLFKNKLINQGIEFCLFIESEKIIYVGKTLTYQEFKEYEFYDICRPIRTIEKGLIPPKLAKIMINLSQIPLNETILDPFCGVGTILQTALLMGYKKVIGTDISKEAVENTKRNIEWLKNNFRQIKNCDIEIFQADVREISKKILKNSIGAIITEPYLGPLKIKNFKLEIENLSKLYLKAFEEFKKILKSDGKIVIIFPIFKINSSYYFIQILNKLKKDWKIFTPFPENFKNPVIRLTRRNSLIYSRKDQKVLREIFIFKKYES
jgi:tRNA (guanine10-N2)-dimethyltransferase